MQTRGVYSIGYDSVDKRVLTILRDGGLKEKQADWRKTTNVEKSGKRFERRVTITPFGDVPEKPEGENYTTDLIRPGHSKDFMHVEFGLGFGVTKTALEDDETRILVKNSTFLMHSLRVTYAKRAADVKNNGFTTELTGDGKPLFATDHILKGGGTFRNEPATAADLSYTSLEQALIDLQTETKDEAGHLIEPIEEYFLEVAPANEFNAHRIVASIRQPGSAENDTNAIKDRRRITVLVNPYLTDADAWFLIPKNKAANGLLSFTRIAPMAEDPVTLPESGNRLYKVRGRQSWGAEYPQGLYGSPGS